MILFADTETFSSVPINKGVHAYSDAPDAELMIVSWAIDDSPVIVRDLTAGDPIGDFYDAVRDADRIVFHNSGFDRVILRKLGQLIIEPERIHDTFVNALCHGMPGALGKLCEIFNISSDKAKDKRGKDLIQWFCKPQPKNQKLRRKTRHTHPVEWQQFLDYAGSDILAMRELYKKMPRWSFFDNSTEHALWCLDQRINDRGFGVDIEFCEAAVRAAADEKVRLKAATQKLTGWDDLTGEGVESTTKRDQLLRYLLGEYGVDLPDLRAGTLERRLADENIPEPVKELLRLRLQASQASPAKYTKMLGIVSKDGRMRGGLQFAGAKRTKRWAGKLFQPQNLPRPSIAAGLVEIFIEALKRGEEDIFTNNLMKSLADALRGVIVAAKGKKIVAVDLSNIEGRVLAWLANETWKLDAFRDFDAGRGPDLYYITASKVLGIPWDRVTKGQRQTSGKVPELACGYQGALGAFAKMAQLYGLNLSESAILKIVRDWRTANENIVTLWKDLEEAAREAILNPGLLVHCRRVTFQMSKAWLKVGMPNGDFMSYASPRVDGAGKISYMGENPYTHQWERIYTYGGKIAENITQYLARAVMAANMPAIEAAGYEIVLSVHDEVIAEADDVAEKYWQEMAKLLCRDPQWPGTEELPLAAAGFEGYRYRKDD